VKDIVRQAKFKADWKRIHRSGKIKEADTNEILHVILFLTSGKPLPAKYRDHSLTCNWKGYRDCHVKPDLVLIYKMSASELVLARIGSHSELF